MIIYSNSHIDKLREFFSEQERNEKLRKILGSFPDPAAITKLDKNVIESLHIQVIKRLLQDIYLSYRKELMKWAEITKQTAIVDPEYLSMHLVSLFTGVPGMGTAARGFDLLDGSEVKSSSRVEQLGKCRRCGAAVMAFEEKCGYCGSNDVERKFDSHWIFSLRNDEEVRKLLSRPAIYLVLLDYEDVNKRNVIRIRIWKLNPSDDFVRIFFNDYYFQEFFKSKINKGKTPAPCNLHPDKPLTKFLMPKLLFRGRIDFTNSEIIIELVNSEGIPEKLSRPEARHLLSEKKGYFHKVLQLGRERGFKQRISELIE